jgi:hypothetical protein
MKKILRWVIIVVLFLAAMYCNPFPVEHPLIALSAPIQVSSGVVSPMNRVMRINQFDWRQYRSQQEYAIWAGSTCSAASMAVVMNAYGHAYRITDVLAIESQIGAISPQLGLMGEAGIARTVAYFGFQAQWGHGLSLAQVIALANRGLPVIVGFAHGGRFAGGHLLVVAGGNASTVSVVDSSPYNLTILSRGYFLQLWSGFSAVVTPGGR